MESDSSWARGWLDGGRSFSDLGLQHVRPLLEEVADHVLGRRDLSWAWRGPGADRLYWLVVQETNAAVRYAVRAVSICEGLVEILLRELGAEETYCRDDLADLEQALFLDRGKGDTPAPSGRWDV